MWVKLRRCLCQSNAYFEIKISGSTANPNKLYYKCKACGKFGWVADADMKNEVAAVVDGVREMADGIADVKEKLGSFVKFMEMVVKMTWFMYIVMVILVMLK